MKEIITLESGTIIDKNIEANRTYRYFNDRSDPKLGGIANMNQDFMLAIDEFRHQLGVPIYINSGFRAGTGTSRHHSGNAIDCKCPSLTIREFYQAALEFTFKKGIFEGIGLYPYWNTPGLHLDFRDSAIRWVREKSGQYVTEFSLEQLDQYLDIASQQSDLWQLEDFCNNDH